MKKQYLAKLATLVGFTATLTQVGCATILSGKNQDVQFDSEPKGATVRVSGKECIAPCTLSLERRDNHNAVFTLNGYESHQVATSSGFNPVSLLNLLDPIAWAIDLGTGSAYTVAPKKISASLKAESPKPENLTSTAKAY